MHLQSSRVPMCSGWLRCKCPLLFVKLPCSWEHIGCNWTCNVHSGSIWHASLTQHRGTTLRVSMVSWKDQKPGQPGLKLLGVTTQQLFNLTSRNFSFLRWYWWTSPGGAGGNEPTCQFRRLKRHRFNPWVRKIPWRWAWQPTPAFLPGESHGQRNLAGYGA